MVKHTNSSKQIEIFAQENERRKGMKKNVSILISYPLKTDTPVYSGSPKMKIEQHKSIANGNSSNTSLLTLSNHTGTHLDLPRHFCDDGPAADDMLSARCEFFPTFCIDLSQNGRIAIRPEDFEDHLSDTCSAEALLIKTGIAERRGTSRYCSNYPYVDPDVPGFLRKFYPDLKVFGIDTLSVSNPTFREMGRACHRNFLCDKPSILIMEDVNLSNSRIDRGPWVLKVFPVFLGNLDAVPVISILELQE